MRRKCNTITFVTDICFVTLTLRNQPVEIGEIIGDTYIAQVVLTNARLGFGGTVPIFIGGNKLQFWGKFLTRFSIGGLLKMGNRKQ